MSWSALGDSTSPGHLVWRVAASVLGIVGVVSALILVSPPTILLTFLLVLGVIGSIHLSISLACEDTPRALRNTVRIAALAAVAVLSVVGYAAAAGPATIPLVLAVLVTSPPALAYFAGGTPSVGQASPTKLGELSDEALCQAWLRSFTALENARTPDECGRIADTRLAYLEELERRHPAEFAEWLATNPRATADPSVYFTDNPTPRPQSD
jgi:hypothetical protein